MADAASLDMPANARSGRSSLDALPAFTILAIAAGFALRVTLGRTQPLWLDETFTGAIAARPTWDAVFEQILNDVNAPLYYLVAHGWALVFGLSNQALRFPALIFGTLAPILCLIPLRAIAPRIRLLWCSLTALWVPGLLFSQEARCYSLLLCLAILGTLAFVQLMSGPTLRRATLWTGLSGLAILTHYHAIFLVAAQGLVLLGVHRARTLRLWPAALLFAPVFAWLALHHQTIARFMDPHIAWYRALVPSELLVISDYILGSSTAMGEIVFLFLALSLSGRARREAMFKREACVVHAILAAVMGTVIVVTAAFWRPSFALRYIVPFVPGCFLGLSVLFDRFSETVWRAAPLVLIILFAANTATDVRNGRIGLKPYNFEAASDALMAAGTDHLVFLWDHPANPAEAPSQLAIVGGFFFHRAGKPVDVVPVTRASNEDPNPRLVALANRPRSAILWLYDTAIHDTVARAYPPRIAAMMPGWRCDDFGEGTFGVLACHDGAPAR